MRYKIEFQYAPDKDSRPLDEAYMVLEGESNNPQEIVLPDVGDYIRIQHADHMPPGEHISGKIRSRYFMYTKFEKNSDEICVINIVVEATDDDWGMILKS